MSHFLSFLSIVLFFAVYFVTRDFFLATMVAIAVVFLQVIVAYIQGKVDFSLKVTFVTILVMGGMTILFQDEIFFKWKPTVVSWVFAVVLLLSALYNRSSQEMNVMKKLMGEQLTLPNDVWLKLAVGWAVGFMMNGAINIYVAYAFSEAAWVNFKVFGLLALMLVYMFIMCVFLMRGGYLEDMVKAQQDNAQEGQGKGE